MWPGPRTLLCLVHLPNLKGRCQLGYLADGCKFLFILCFLPCVLSLLHWGALLVSYGLRLSLSSSAEMLVGTSGHYSNKNNRNLIRSQKICVVFTALVVSVIWVFGFFCPFKFYIKQFSEEGVCEYCYFCCLFHWLCTCMLAKPPLLPLVLSLLV